MNGRAGVGDLCLTSALACTIGVLAFCLIGLAFDASMLGLHPALVESFFGAMAIAVPFAIVTVFPLGCVIAWLISRSGPPSALRAALAGALTGAVWVTLFYLMLSKALPSDAGARWFFAGMTMLGAVSGWCAFRIVFRRSRDAPAEAFTTAASDA